MLLLGDVYTTIYTIILHYTYTICHTHHVWPKSWILLLFTQQFSIKVKNYATQSASASDSELTDIDTDIDIDSDSNDDTMSITTIPVERPKRSTQCKPRYKEADDDSDFEPVEQLSKRGKK